MRILVINAGSSSLKYQLINMENEQVIAKGNCDRIGIGGHIAHKTFDGRTVDEDCDFPTHTEAFKKLIDTMTHGQAAVIKDVSEISAIGHRIVQGAELFPTSEIVTPEVIDKIESINDLAPLHNPAHVQALRACQKVFGPDVPEVVVFDTSFHQSMPQSAYMYAIPYEFYEKYHVRKYGFHGTSHRYVSNELARIMGKDIKDLKIVSCHLGNGSSICCIQGGRSMDTSMGFTPLDGLIMGTRSGAIDASVVTFLADKENISAHEMSELLNKKSGYLGISGVSSDNRDLTASASGGDARSQLAIDMQRHQIKKYIGAYAALMNGLDAIIFTGGIGENAWDMREDVCSNMEYLGISIDKAKNKDNNGKLCNFSAPDSKVQTWILPTNEELLIAKDTLELISK